MTVVSMNAPTHGAPQERKEEFYNDLQTTLDNAATQRCCVAAGERPQFQSG